MKISTYCVNSLNDTLDLDKIAVHQGLHDPQNIVHVGLTGLRVEVQVMAALPEDKYKTIIRVAASDMSEDELAQWTRNNLKAIRS